MKKRKTIALISSLITLCCVSVTLIAVNAKVNDETDQKVIYSTDFEGMLIDKNSTVDSNTGFIWANDWQNSKTVQRNGSTMFDWTVIDSTESNKYSTVGGFGIASNSNLAKCNNGEAYTTSAYIEIENIEYVFVEYVGGTDKWGSCIIYPNGKIVENVGGNNMSNVSYVNNILEFTFTMSFNDVEKVNGYIKFTAYNSKNGHIYLDDVSIKHTKYVLNEDYEKTPVEVFDTHTSNWRTNYYAVDGVKSEYIKVNNDTKAKMSFTLNQNESGESVFFLNRLGFLNKNRRYQLSFDMDTTNISNVWIYYGGTWAEPVSYAQINIGSGSVNKTGTALHEVTYKNKNVYIDFNTNVEFADWQQFQFIVQVNNANQLSEVYIDNLLMYQIPVVSELSLTTSAVKTSYYYGEEFDSTNLKVTAIYSNDTTKEVSLADCQISGYNKEKIGIQEITVTYQGISEKYNVTVKRKLASIKIDTTSVKTFYNYGESIDLTGLVVKAKAENIEEEYVLNHGAALGGYSIFYGEFDPYTPGTYTILVTYLDASATFEVIVGNRTPLKFDSTTYQETGK